MVHSRRASHTTSQPAGKPGDVGYLITFKIAGSARVTFLPIGQLAAPRSPRYVSALWVWLGDAVSLPSRAGVSRDCVRPRCA